MMGAADSLRGKGRTFLLGCLAVLLLIPASGVLSAQQPGDCEALVERCEEISRTNCEEAGRLNCERARYSGCGVEIACSYAYPYRSDALCELAYKDCDKPGYVACADGAMATYQGCLGQCNAGFRNSGYKTYGEHLQELDKLGQCGRECRMAAEASLDACRGQVDDPEEYCKDYCRKQGAHLIWDGESYPRDCGCICEKGWEMLDWEGVVQCVECEKVCQKLDARAHYNDKKSEPNKCE